jgi:hypothetical protein
MLCCEWRKKGIKMVDTVKRGTIRYYLDRRAEIVEILALGGHSPEQLKTLVGARDMATERIQQLTNIRVMGDIIVPLEDDRALDRLLRDVIRSNHAKHEFFNDDGAGTRQD